MKIFFEESNNSSSSVTETARQGQNLFLSEKQVIKGNNFLPIHATFVKEKLRKIPPNHYESLAFPFPCQLWKMNGKSFVLSKIFHIYFAHEEHKKDFQKNFVIAVMASQL